MLEIFFVKTPDDESSEFETSDSEYDNTASETASENSLEGVVSLNGDIAVKVSENGNGEIANGENNDDADDESSQKNVEKKPKPCCTVCCYKCKKGVRKVRRRIRRFWRQCWPLRKVRKAWRRMYEYFDIFDRELCSKVLKEALLLLWLFFLASNHE